MVLSDYKKIGKVCFFPSQNCAIIGFPLLHCKVHFNEVSNLVWMGWVGGVNPIQIIFGLLEFFIFTKPLSYHVLLSEHHFMVTEYT